MRALKKTSIILGAMLATLTFAAESCDGTTDAQQQDETNKSKGIDHLLTSQPAPQMKYSPTRNTIIAWVKKWEQPGKLAYTYITDGPNDPKGGYYVFVGPPVSYCVGLTPPDRVVSDSEGKAVRQAPGVDGVFGGGDCSIFYGIDAVTKNIVTFSVGLGQNMFYADQPNARYKSADPLGSATIATAKGQ